MAKKPTKAAEPEAGPELEAPEPSKAKGKGDPHDRIDRLEALMRANGWTL